VRQGDGSLRLLDSRSDAVRPSLVLRGYEQAAYEYCDELRSAGQVAAYLGTRFAGQSFDSAAVDACLASLVANRLMLSDGAHYLSLAILATAARPAPADATLQLSALGVATGAARVLGLGMANPRNEPLASAQVVLRSASGRAPTGSDVISAETLGEFLPTPDAVEKVKQFFTAAGFDVGSVVGNSLSITAPAQLFERVFKARPRRLPSGGLSVRGGGTELPLDALPAPVRAHIAAVAFPEPPAFGPGRP
jgi:hypothetical protein